MNIFTIHKDENKQIVIEKPGKYSVELVGRGAKVEILGAFIIRNSDDVEISVTTIHKAPDTEANTFLRAVVYDQAKVTLSGLINVQKIAQKTNAFLKENVLLLSDKARAEAIPNLEIEANDVKCSHAATVGMIDEEQLFYLMSRGMTRRNAEAMIVDGFLGEVQDKIHNSGDERE